LAPFDLEISTEMMNALLVVLGMPLAKRPLYLWQDECDSSISPGWASLFLASALVFWFQRNRRHGGNVTSLPPSSHPTCPSSRAF